MLGKEPPKQMLLCEAEGSEPAACTGHQGRLAKPRPMHQRWAKAHTSFGENCVHTWKVSSKTLKPVCSSKTHKHPRIILPPGSRQVAEVPRGFTITMPPAIQYLTTWKALATGKQHLPFRSVCIPALNENLQLKITTVTITPAVVPPSPLAPLPEEHFLLDSTDFFQVWTTTIIRTPTIKGKTKATPIFGVFLFFFFTKCKNKEKGWSSLKETSNYASLKILTVNSGASIFTKKYHSKPLEKMSM